MAGGVVPKGVKRVVYRVFLEGDLRKAQAESADAGTGGGARDLRLRPHNEFGDVFERIFPERRVQRQKRGGTYEDVEILCGRFSWMEGSTVKSAAAEYWPPTVARPGEGRVAKIYNYPPLRLEPPSKEGRLVVLIVQDANDLVWPYIVTEDSLRSGAWDAKIAGPILECLDAHPSGAPRGFVDVERGLRSCFG
jgi:hypothetical protein